MKLIDFLFCLASAASTSGFVYLGWWAQAVFSGMFFVVIMVSMIIHYLSQPLPRFIIGTGILVDPKGIQKQEAEQETK